MSIRFVLAPLLAAAGLAAALATVPPAAAASIGGDGTLRSVARCAAYAYGQTPPYRRCVAWVRNSAGYR